MNRGNRMRFYGGFFSFSNNRQGDATAAVGAGAGAVAVGTMALETGGAETVLLQYNSNYNNSCVEVDIARVMTGMETGSKNKKGNQSSKNHGQQRVRFVLFNSLFFKKEIQKKKEDKALAGASTHRTALSCASDAAQRERAGYMVPPANPLGGCGTSTGVHQTSPSPQSIRARALLGPQPGGGAHRCALLLVPCPPTLSACLPFSALVYPRPFFPSSLLAFFFLFLFFSFFPAASLQPSLCFLFFAFTLRIAVIFNPLYWIASTRRRLYTRGRTTTTTTNRRKPPSPIRQKKEPDLNLTNRQNEHTSRRNLAFWDY